jgi:hypothetical protein
MILGKSILIGPAMQLQLAVNESVDESFAVLYE